MKKLFYFFLLTGFLVLLPLSSYTFAQEEESCGCVVAQEDKKGCAVYFSGSNCTHCAKASPELLGRHLHNHPDWVIVEYEVQGPDATVFEDYRENYSIAGRIPQLLFNSQTGLVGDGNIIDQFGVVSNNNRDNLCPLPEGNSEEFANLSLTALPGQPRIWVGHRVLILTAPISSEGGFIDNEGLKNLLHVADPRNLLEHMGAKKIEPEKIHNIGFENAVVIDGVWKFQWDGPALAANYTNETNSLGGEVAGTKKEENCKDLTLAKILSLGAADSVNPCSIAVLTAMLLAILTYNPEKKRKVILAGLAFTASVFVMYLIYGLVIIRFFQLVQALASIRTILYKILGIAAMVVGLYNIKEFLEGNSACHVVPQIGKLLSKITSPKGAFTIGALVTIFLLPCTIGPYVICGGILSTLSLLKTLPWLVLYNFVFVLPMVAVILVVYFGFSTVENVSGWQAKNIKYLNLGSGLIIFALGLAMIFGWV